MNKIINLKIFSFIIFLTLLFTQGCGEFSKDRPPTNLSFNPANYKVKPSVYIITTFQYNYNSIDHSYSRNEDDTLKKIVEKVVKENELFEWYSAEDVNTWKADYRMDMHLSNTTMDGDLTLSQSMMGMLSAMTFFLLPVPIDKKQYVLNTTLWDELGKKSYSYTCTSESTATQYSLMPPLGMIEKMVKETLFTIINNSGIMKSYKIEP